MSTIQRRLYFLSIYVPRGGCFPIISTCLMYYAWILFQSQSFFLRRQSLPASRADRLGVKIQEVQASISLHP